MRLLLLPGLTGYLFVQSPAVAKCCKLAISQTPVQQAVKADTVVIGRVVDLDRIW